MCWYVEILLVCGLLFFNAALYTAPWSAVYCVKKTKSRYSFFNILKPLNNTDLFLDLLLENSNPLLSAPLGEFAYSFESAACEPGWNTSSPFVRSSRCGEIGLCSSFRHTKGRATWHRLCLRACVCCVLCVYITGDSVWACFVYSVTIGGKLKGEVRAGFACGLCAWVCTCMSVCVLRVRLPCAGESVRRGLGRAPLLTHSLWSTHPSPLYSPFSHYALNPMTAIGSIFVSLTQFKFQG